MKTMSIAKNRKYLDEDFIPSKLLFRDSQIKDLDYIRNCVIDQQNQKSMYGGASDALLLGGPGTGKTALLRDLLAKARQFLARSPNTNVRIAYIDCSQISNERTFWVKLASEINVYYTATSSLDQIRQDVLKVLETNSLLILLDEIDSLILDNETIFDQVSNQLSRTHGVVVVAAANRKDWRKGLGQKNTFNPRIISCNEYNREQLRDLAIDRVIHALNGDDIEITTIIIENIKKIVTLEAIVIIATRAFRLGGDARKLIKMLRIAFEQAEMSQRNHILIEDVQYACTQIEDDAQQLLDSLQQKSHDVHVVLLAIHYLNEGQESSEDDEGVRSLNILAKYQEFIEQSDPTEEPLKYRSIMDLVQKLYTEGLVDRQRAKTRGNVWYYEINEDYFAGQEVLNLLAKICKKCQKIINQKNIIA